jgi:hypothetical protein
VLVLVLAVYTVLPAGSRRTDSCPQTAAPSAGGSLQAGSDTMVVFEQSQAADKAGIHDADCKCGLRNASSTVA